MKIDKLSKLISVCRTGSLSIAANQLGVSPPALSRVVREIEAATGLQLFERTGRGMKLSTAGQQFRDQALRVLAEYDQLLALVEDLKSSTFGEVGICLPARVGRVLTADLMRQFYLRFPRANINIYEDMNLGVQENIIRRIVDISVYYTPPSPTGIIEEVIAEDEIYFCGKPELMGDIDIPISMGEAAEYPMLLQPNELSYFKDFAIRTFKNAGYRINVSRELGTVDSIISFAAEGEGFLLMPYSAIIEECNQGVLGARKIVDPTFSRKVVIATSTANPLVRQTTQILKTIISQHASKMRWKQKIGA